MTFLKTYTRSQPTLTKCESSSKAGIQRRSRIAECAGHRADSSRLRTLLAEVTSSLKWKLLNFDTLETWTKGPVALLGDACHPTLPYQGQGAAMAVEDGACVSTLLGLAAKTGNASIPQTLQLYERLRKDRTTLSVKGAADNRVVYHATDGEFADRRNALLQDYEWDNDPRETPLSFNDPEYQQALMGFDTVADAEAVFQREFVVSNGV